MAGMPPRERQSKPSLWRVNPLCPAPGILAHVSSVLAMGGTVVYPTETFYGLGAHPCEEEAVRRVYILKGRDPGKPLPCIASDMAAVSGAISVWPPEAEALARSFWPGPLTIILPASADLPSIAHAGTGKIALRISSHPVARALAARVGGLLVSTSANPAGGPPCLRVRDIPGALLARVDGVLDAGDLPGGLPSTIVDLTCMPPRLVRTGRVPWESIVESIRSPSE